MEFASPGTVSTMMRTCRTLYQEAHGPHLLLREGITLSRDRQIISFYSFMLANPPGRFRFLHALTLSKGNFSDTAVDTLANLLDHPDLHLESLVLHDAEEVLRSSVLLFETDGYPYTGVPLTSAIASLTTVRHLEMDGLDECAYALLEIFPPGLVSVVLMLDSLITQWSAPARPEEYNPIVLLAQQADTLEVLEGSGFDADPDNVRYDVVYPRMRRITVRHARPWRPATVAYVHAFPSLEHFALFGTEDMHAGLAGPHRNPFAERALEMRRSQNREDQMNDGSWQRLRVIEGDVFDVYALGLLCPVPEVRLQGVVFRSTIHYLEAILDDVRPVTLTATILGGCLFEENGEMTSLLRRPEAQCLRELELEVCFEPQEGDTITVDEMMDDIRHAVSPVPLHTLRLTLNHGFLIKTTTFPDHHSLPEDYGLSLHAARRRQKRLDLKVYSDSFLDSMPTLESVVVTLSNDAQAYEYMLSSDGSRSASPSESVGSQGQAEMLQALAELGFGDIRDGEDDGW
ncbi:hypothetical protein C8Q79DRAFT_912559 [Trametes meyenii]|nr:hypothetical protein C8Q79DRAFT_912559 [Trametes meyenii]